MTSWENALRRLPLVAIAAIGLAMLAPSAATPAARDAIVTWEAQTPPEGAVIGVAAKTQLSVPFAASAPGAPAVIVRIRASGNLPAGAVLRISDGNPAKATLRWTPSASQVGAFQLTFIATTDVPTVSAQRSIVVRVGKSGQPPPGPPPPPGVWPRRFMLSERAKETYRWAFMRHAVMARGGPSRATRMLSRLGFRTPELYRNAVLALDGVKYRNGQTWVRVRLAILPNSSTGWVPRRSLA